MQLKERPALRLVDGASAEAATPALAPGAEKTAAYYRRIKSYAQRIRRSQDVDGIIRLLEAALQETGELHRDHTVHLARAEVERAEARIDALRMELEATRRLVQIDHLTGALNRAGFEHVYTREAAFADRHQMPLGVALLDIDDFKLLNDIHGHQAGDAALVHLAGILKSALRPTDAIVRYGGEEFLVLLPHSGLAHGARAIERVQEQLALQPLIYERRRLRFTFSAGAAERRPGEAQAEVIGRADHGLYRAKRNGKRRVVSCA